MMFVLTRLTLVCSLVVGGCNCTGNGVAGGSGAASTSSTGSHAAGEGLQRLGSAPLCEASALVRVGAEFWVADNEVEDRVFRFDGELTELEAWSMPRSDRPRDIEALAYDGGLLLVVGSHSPKRDGSRQDRRHRTRLLRVGDDGLTPVAAFDTGNVEASRDSCMRGLFESPSGDELDAAHAFCDELARVGSMNIEGATAMGGRFWVGFRSPLVEGRAVVGRLTGSSRSTTESTTGALRFDRLRFIDLGGQGVRAMDALDDVLYLIAGPVTDDDSPHSLYRLNGDENAERLTELPTSSEGLALLNAHEAFVVIDGMEGNDIACHEPSRWTRARW